MGEDAWLEAAYEDAHGGAFDTADLYGYEEPDEVGEPFVGICDGCESGREQAVRRLTGGWGTAVVCEFHEDHV